MKRVRVQRLAGQLLPPVAARPLSSCAFHSSASALAPRSAVAATTFTSSSSSSSLTLTSTSSRPSSFSLSASCSPAAARQQSTSASASSIDNSNSNGAFTSPYGAFGGRSKGTFMSTEAISETITPGLGPSVNPRFPELAPDAATAPAYPSPLPARARQSAKLAALHARLGLSQRLPLETLARTLVDASADPSPRFNNSNLAYLGVSMMHFHVTEWLMVKYPRLPMVILHGALKAFAGPQALADVARQWGVEQAAAPGAEVDPGLLQYSLLADRHRIGRWGYQRKEAKHLKKYKWRHGISSRIVFDDDFGDVMEDGEASAEESGEVPADFDASATELGGSMNAVVKTRLSNEAHANAVRAVVGAVYAHCGREAVRSFVRAHVLSRQLDLESLFRFKLPTRELTYLCARENFEPPVARLESETGRMSRTPVFVVGIYSGADKLGEGAGASLDMARQKAAMNALKSWYLYSPGENVRVPSDTLLEDVAPWEPVYVDIGEIL
ncbi:54S ribosomal protein L3 mitochondrial [Sporothrix stenoceras]|uniref:Large ribosomal subunit protein mL44 n=1 Tax=Sporothrix stenoceras TaxID=5173 RepID=A0ABR3ZME3_9PEZI